MQRWLLIGTAALMGCTARGEGLDAIDAAIAVPDAMAVSKPSAADALDAGALVGAPQPDAADGDPVDGEPPGSDSEPQTRCAPAAGATGSPETIAQAVALINSLPRPTSLACFIESLDRPLEVYLTNSPLSLQPAPNAKNPRIFLVRGSLVMSIVPAGRGSPFLEFGYQTSSTRSIKGEIEFPVRAPVTPASLAERIRIDAVSVCGGCHVGEVRVNDELLGESFESNIIVPFETRRVSLESLREEASACDRVADPARCELLSALFAHGPVEETALWSEP